MRIHWVRLREETAFLERAALWFSARWDIPAEEYRSSMRACAARKTGVPQWYVAVDMQQNILAGAGVIENDFHDRKDLAPNVCALFVEAPYRRRDLAREMLRRVRCDLGSMGYDRLYLVTDHTAFYEACGWQFLTMVQDVSGVPERLYTAPTLR